jgi:SAM-dependent methyltransferase
MIQATDREKGQAFMTKMLGIYNGASLAYMVSIGHQTRLFDTMAALPPSTSEQIADAAGLNERYVREWLAAVVTGEIAEYEPANRTYWLPADHAAYLTRAAGPRNLAARAQITARNGAIEPKIVQCFYDGRGLPYSEYAGFPEMFSEFTALILDANLIDNTLPLVPGLVERLTAGIDLADVGCGAGHAINLMGQAFPNSRFTGYDFSREGIALGEAEARTMRLGNVRFEVKDAATLDSSLQFDAITVFDAIHDQAHPARVLSGIYESLKVGADFLCVDVAASSNLEDNLNHPMAPSLYTASAMHCMTVSLGHGGVGLGTMWGEQKALQMLGEAGFKDVAVRKVEGDIINNYYICRK